jgi:hypothetical protein
MVSAFEVLRSLREEDFPKNLREKWKWIVAETTKNGSGVNKYTGEVLQNSAENTMRNRKNSTASKIAKAVYDLYWAVSENTRYL